MFHNFHNSPLPKSLGKKSQENHLATHRAIPRLQGARPRHQPPPQLGQGAAGLQEVQGSLEPGLRDGPGLLFRTAGLELFLLPSGKLKN